MRWSSVTGVAIAGLAMGALGCSSQAIDQQAGAGRSGATATGAGGGGGAGGRVAVDAAPPLGSLAVFDSDTEGFAFDTYGDPTSTNLADANNPAVPMPTLTFDATQGSPSPGSLQVMAPFSGANQYVGILKTVSAPLDWSGMTLHVRIKVSPGTPFQGTVQLYVATTSAYAFGGTATQVAPGSEWHEYTLNLSKPLTLLPGYDPAEVVLVGVQFNTGNAGAGATPVVFNIDSFYLTP